MDCRVCSEQIRKSVVAVYFDETGVGHASDETGLRNAGDETGSAPHGKETGPRHTAT